MTRSGRAELGHQPFLDAADGDAGGLAADAGAGQFDHHAVAIDVDQFAVAAIGSQIRPHSSIADSMMRMRLQHGHVFGGPASGRGLVRAPAQARRRAGSKASAAIEFAGGRPSRVDAHQHGFDPPTQVPQLPAALVKCVTCSIDVSLLTRMARSTMPSSTPKHLQISAPSSWSSAQVSPR